jgi:hypothetical protein
MRNLKLCGIVITMIASPAFGQAPSGQDCNTLANTIAVGYTTSFSNRDFNALRYYANCEAKASNAGGGLSIAYNSFSLGGNYSEAQSSQQCQQSRETLGINDTEYHSAKVVFTQALATIDRCLELAAQGWGIKYAQVGSDAVSLTLSHGGANGGRLLGAEAVPPGSLVCNPALPSQPTNLTSVAPFSTICYRSPVSQLVDGIQIKSAEDSTINLRLDSGPFLIPLKGYQSSVILKLQERIDQNAAQLRSLLPQLADFYVKPIPSVVQYSDASCDADILISATCTNSHGAQTAVGPKFFDKDGKRWASCERYGPAGQTAEGQLICLKHR